MTNYFKFALIVFLGLFFTKAEQGYSQSFLSYRGLLDVAEVYSDSEDVAAVYSESEDDITTDAESLIISYHDSPLQMIFQDVSTDIIENKSEETLYTDKIIDDSFRQFLKSQSELIEGSEGITFFWPEPEAEDIRQEESLENIESLQAQGEYRQSLSVLLNQIDGQSERSDRFEYYEKRQFLLIKSFFHLGEDANVIEAAERYFNYYGNGQNFFQAYYYFAVSLSRLDLPLEYTSLVTDEFFLVLGAREKQNLRRILIEDAIEKDELLVAFDFLMDENRELIEGFEPWVEAIIKDIEDIDDLQSIELEYENELIQSSAYLRRIQLLIRDGKYAQAREYLEELYIDETISVDMLDEIQQLHDYVNIVLNTDYRKIGVILPFSHRHPLYRQIASQVADGLELALSEYASDNKPIELVFRDNAKEFTEESTTGERVVTSTAERMELTKKRVKELVEEEQVIAILGPITKDNSLAAGMAVEKYKVPVISFSLSENVGKDLPYLFRFQRNQIQEARFLANYACDYLQAERFVLFYTENRSGKGYAIMRAFEETIKAKGGKVVGVTSVGNSKVDFKQNYLAMTGGLRPLSEEEEEELKNSTEKKTPIVDFDVMFVPTSIRQLGIILDFNRSFNAEKVWVLAGSNINVQENQLLSRTSRLRFVDSFPISSVRTELQPFYESHWKKFNYRKNYRPPTNYTIYAYEALEVVARLLNDPKLHSRESLKDALSVLYNFPILTGEVSVSENGEFEKGMNILRIKDKTTIPVF